MAKMIIKIPSEVVVPPTVVPNNTATESAPQPAKPKAQKALEKKGTEMAKTKKPKDNKKTDKAALHHAKWVDARKKVYEKSIANRDASIGKLMKLVEQRREINKRLTQKMRALK